MSAKSKQMKLNLLLIIKVQNTTKFILIMLKVIEVNIAKIMNIKRF